MYLPTPLLIIIGLTLIYCTWISPEEIFSSATSNDINACSIVLFVITERWPGARKYRDAFEAVKQNVIDPLAAGKNHVPRQPIAELKSIVPPSLPSSLEMSEDRQEFSRIVTDMAGDPVINQATGAPSMNMEQVQYLGVPGSDQGFGAFSGYGIAANNAQESIDSWTQWPATDMDFTVGFESFDFGAYAGGAAEPFESTMK